MKKILAILSLIFIYGGSALAADDKIGALFQEADGSPAGYAYKVVFPNGTLSLTGSVATYAGESGAAAEVQDEAFTEPNFNGDTSHAVSQDDFYDYIVQIDPDLDGNISGVLTNEASLYATLSDVSQFYEPGDLLRTLSSNSPGAMTQSGEFQIDADDEQFQIRVGSATKTMDFSGDSSGYVLKSDGSGNFSLAADATGSGGSAIIYDLADDGSNESLDLTELAVTGDTNGIFSEPSANKALVNVGNAWPTANVAQAGDSATAFFSGGAIEHEYGGLEEDVSDYNGLLRITGGVTSEVSVSANGLSFIGAADYAAMKGLLDVDDLNTLSGVGAGEINLGLFTGSTITDSVSIKTAIQELETAFEAGGGGGSGDITSVLSDATGEVPTLLQTWTAFTAADATPAIVNWKYRTVDTTTITDFDGTIADGQSLRVYCGAATVFDFTGSGLVSANRTTDMTCDVGQIVDFEYRTDTWYCTNCPDESISLSSDGLVVNDGGTPEAVSIAGTGLAVVTNGDGTDGNPSVAVTAAVASDINTGTSTTTAVTPDALAGSTIGTQYVTVPLIAPTDTLTVGDDKNRWTVPADFDGWNLVFVQASVYTASSSGLPTFQVRDITNGHDLLSTAATIDTSETTSTTAATPAVINATYQTLSGDVALRFDVDGAGTGTAGGEVTIGLRRP